MIGSFGSWCATCGKAGSRVYTSCNPPQWVWAGRGGRFTLKELADAPKAGDKWGANVYRFVRELVWSPTYGSFQKTARFGTLRFVNGKQAGSEVDQ